MQTTSTGILQFTKPTYKITESGTWVGDRVAVSRTGGSSGIASVKVSSKTESATVGKDLERISVLLTWADGEEGEKYIPTSIVQDAYEEGEETVLLSLSSAKGAKYAPVKTAQLIIVDRENDAIAPNQINDNTLINLVPVLGGAKGIRFGDIKSLILDAIPSSNGEGGVSTQIPGLTVVTDSYNIINNSERIGTNVDGFARTITLPANPMIGDEVEIIYIRGNAVLVDLNGKNIRGNNPSSIAKIEINSTNKGGKLVYADPAYYGWTFHPCYQNDFLIELL